MLECGKPWKIRSHESEAQAWRSPVYERTAFDLPLRLFSMADGQEGSIVGVPAVWRGPRGEGVTATARTLAYLRKLGWRPGVVEQFIRMGGRGGFRRDLFGFADIIAYRRDAKYVLAVQSTVGSHHAAHNRKYESDPNVRENLKDWLKNHQFWIVSWRKGGDRGKRKTWQPRIERVAPGSLA